MDDLARLSFKKETLISIRILCLASATFFSIYTAVKPIANILRDNACAIAVSKTGGAKIVAHAHWLKCLLISRSTYLTSPVHHVSVEPDLDCLPNLPGVLVALSLSRI